MDLMILISIASTVLVLLLTLLYFREKNDKTKKGQQQQQQQQPQQQQRPVPLRAQEGIPRRAQIARNQRLRTANALGAAGAGANNRQQQQQQNDLPNNNNNDMDHDPNNDSDGGGGGGRAVPDFGDEKMGAKKRAKLEAKAEKKNQREHELKIREDRKKQEALQAESRRKLDEKEKTEELQREESERLAREDRERKEMEEYLKMKQGFSVEEEGYDDDDAADADGREGTSNLLQEFIDYIKINKVVFLEDLAIAFQLKTTAVIERIQTLQEQGILTGVIDDRGKFIYISEEELEAVAKFIRQRGRVSITELAACSNKLVIVIPPTEA